MKASDIIPLIPPMVTALAGLVEALRNDSDVQADHKAVADLAMLSARLDETSYLVATIKLRDPDALPGR